MQEPVPHGALVLILIFSQGVFLTWPDELYMAGRYCHIYNWNMSYIEADCWEDWGHTERNLISVRFGGETGWWDMIRRTYSYGEPPPAALDIMSVECSDGGCLDVGSGVQTVTIYVSPIRALSWDSRGDCRHCERTPITNLHYLDLSHTS